MPKLAIPIEKTKLTKKQLATETYLCNDKGALLTIGELSIDQLRVMVYRSEKEFHQAQKAAEKIVALLENTLL